MEKIETLETEMRDLRGHLEESRHEVDLLKKQFDVFNTDLDVRLPSSSGQKEEDVFTLPDEGKATEDHIKEVSFSRSEDGYEKAKNLLEKGNYDAAEKAFSAFLKDQPTHEHAGAALYWLGVTYFVEGNFEKAAAHFAKVYKNYPKSPKSPDSLLKLAKSLGSLGRKGDACTTLEQLAKDFPKAFPKEVRVESKKYNCK
jgi:tol-pal system protein YbgF